MDKLFRIGDMARMFHLSMGSIRHYEAMGLLTPDQVDPATGYRYYSTRQFEIFNTIRYLRALDMPLEEIRDFLQNRDVDLIEAKLRQQKQIVVEKQRELKRIQRKIDNRLRQLEDAKASELDQIRETVSPACRLYWVSQSLQITSYHDMEEPTLRLAQCQNEAVIFLGKVGLGLTAEHLRQGQFQQYDGIFLVLDEEDQFDNRRFFGYANHSMTKTWIQRRRALAHSGNRGQWIYGAQPLRGFGKPAPAGQTVARGCGYSPAAAVPGGHAGGFCVSSGGG